MRASDLVVLRFRLAVRIVRSEKTGAALLRTAKVGLRNFTGLWIVFPIHDLGLLDVLDLIPVLLWTPRAFDERRARRASKHLDTQQLISRPENDADLRWRCAIARSLLDPDVIDVRDIRRLPAQNDHGSVADRDMRGWLSADALFVPFGMSFGTHAGMGIERGGMLAMTYRFAGTCLAIGTLVSPDLGYTV